MTQFRPPYDVDTTGTNVAPEAYDPKHGGAAAGRDLSKVEGEEPVFDLATRFAADPDTVGSPEDVPEVSEEARVALQPALRSENHPLRRGER